MNKKAKKKLISLVSGIVVFLLLLLLDGLKIINIDEYVKSTSIIEEQALNKDSNSYEVMRVVDGDTFVIMYGNTQEKVRLIGVDTPESVHPDDSKNTEFGNMVSEYTKQSLLGKYVVLEFDVEQRDKYGRLLAYVYLDGVMYNKILLEKGYAKLATYPPNVKYVEEFKQIQKQARENKAGLWGV